MEDTNVELRGEFMHRYAWKVSDLLLLVLSAGLAFGAFRYFWQPAPHPNIYLFLSSYLALLAIATLGSFLGKPALRRPCQGFAAFGWLNLVCVIQGGFEVSTSFDAERIVEGSQMGVAFGAVCALVAAWFLEPPRDTEPPAGPTPGSDRGRDDDATVA
jgi:hypothetical protein